MAETWPTHDNVVTMLRLPDASVDNDVVEWARLAAIDYVIGRVDPQRCGWAEGDDPRTAAVPDAVFEATLLGAARWYRRRDSLDGTIGWGEQGVVRVGYKDPDVDAALAQYMAIPIG